MNSSPFNIIPFTNVSKKKRFPVVPAAKNPLVKASYTNEYFVYDLTKKTIGAWLNTWFYGVDNRDSKERIYTHEIWTVKKVDKETALHLYSRKYNPVSLVIYCPPGAKFKTNDHGQLLYNFKATIHSIDDSSYGMWWFDLTLEEIVYRQVELMTWINSQRVINGEDWFKVGKELNAVDFDTN